METEGRGRGCPRPLAQIFAEMQDARTGHPHHFRQRLRQAQASSYEYRVTGRGGKGIVAMAVNARNGELVASMPVEGGDQIMLVTNGGQLIRCPVAGIRKIGRGGAGRDRVQHGRRRKGRVRRAHRRDGRGRGRGGLSQEQAAF